MIRFLVVKSVAFYGSTVPIIKLHIAYLLGCQQMLVILVYLNKLHVIHGHGQCHLVDVHI